MRKQTIRRLVIGAAALSAAAMLSGCGGTKLNVLDYVQVRFTGLNGEGQAVVEFDEEAALNAIAAASKEGLSENEKTSIRNILSIAERDIAVSTESGLKNGDQITVTTKLDSKNLKEYKTTLSNGQKKFDVSGLVDGVTIDLTDYVTFSYQGFDGIGTAYAGFDWDGYLEAVNAQITAAGSAAANDIAVYEVRNAPYVSSPEQIDLSNGDTVTATVTAEQSQYDSIGIILEGGEATGTVEGLQEPQQVDLAEAVTPVITGICPNLNVNYNVNWDLPYADAITRPDSGRAALNNGDTLSGTIEYDENYLKRNGYLVGTDAYSYTISDMPTYLVDFSQEKAQETVKAWADEKVAAGAFGGSIDAAESFLSDYSWGDLQNAQIQLAGIYGSTADEAEARAAAEKAIQNASEGNQEILPPSVYNKLYFITMTSLPVLQENGTTSVQNVYTVDSIGKLIQAGDGTIYDPSEILKDEYGNQIEEKDYDADGNEVSLRVWSSESYTSFDEARSAIDADIAETLGSSAAVTVVLENEVSEAEGSSGEAHALPEVTIPEAASVDPALVSQAVSGPVVLDGHTYLAFNEINGSLLNWNQAKQFCEQNGGHLVTVGSITEQSVLNYLKDTADRSIYYWIGLSDRENEGAFYWVTGERAEFTYFDGSQPDNDEGSDENGEDAVEAFWGSYGRWNDRPAGYDGNGFMMEIEPVSAGTEGLLLSEETPSYQREAEAQWYRTDSFGNLHIYPMGMDSRDRARLDYDLNGEYSLVSFSLSVEQDASSDANIDVKVWGDGRLLYSYLGLTKTSAPQDIVIDVTGVDRISIQTRNDSGSAMLLLGEGKLIRSDEEKPVRFVRSFENLDNMTFANADTTYPMPQDKNGRRYREMYRMYNKSEMSWNLSGQFTYFQAVAAPAELIDYNAADIRIYGDGNLLYEKRGYTGLEGVVLLKADVTGVNVLKIEVSPTEEDGRNQEVEICDTLLTGEAPAETEDVSPADADEEASGEETGAAGADEAASDEETAAAGTEMTLWDVVSETVPASETAWDVIAEPQDAGTQETAAGAVQLQTGEDGFPMLPEEYEAAAAGVITCGPVRYYRFDNKVNYMMATSLAGKMGASLAVPETEEQWLAIAKLLEGNGDDWHFLGIQKAPQLGAWERSDHQRIDSGAWILSYLPEQNDERPFVVETSDGDLGLTDAVTTYGYVVEVRSSENTEQAEYVNLTGFEWNTKGTVRDISYVHSDGKFSGHSMMLEFYDYASLAVDLAGGYSEFSGTLICDYMYPGQTASYAVFGDGKLLFEKNHFSAKDLEEPVPFTVDVNGVKTLSIEAKQSNGDTMRLVTADIRLTPAQQAAPSGIVRLQNMDTVDRSGVDIYPNELLRDRNGVLHDGCFRMNSGTSYLYYNLNGQYTSLSLTLTAGYYTDQNDMLFQVLADDQVIWEETFNAGMPNVTKELDVTGVKVLQIRKDKTESAEGHNTLYLEDDFLQ